MDQWTPAESLLANVLPDAVGLSKRAQLLDVNLDLGEFLGDKIRVGHGTAGVWWATRTECLSGLHRRKRAGELDAEIALT